MYETYKMNDFARGKTLKTGKQFFSLNRMKLLLLMLSISLSGFGQVLVGAGNTTNSTGPWSSCWGFSYHQMIYPQNQIGAAGTITSLTFTVTGSLPTVATGATPATPQGANTAFRIFLGHTTKSDFTSNTDWIPVGNMNLVFDGSLSMPTAAGQSVVVTLTTPFAYNNTDNLVIAFDENSPGYACTYTWVANSTQTNRNLFFRSDTVNPDPSAPASGARASTTPQVTLGGLVVANPPSCVTNFAPAENASNVALNPTFSWTNPPAPVASSFDVYFGTSSNPPLLGNFASAAAATNAIPSPLMPNSTYFVKVVPKNDAGEALNCATSSFTTGSSFNYCASNATNSADTKVGSFSLAGVAKDAANGCVTYTDRTSDTPFLLPQGVAVPVSISLGTCSSDFYASYAKIFVDVNLNGNFEANEMLYEGALTTTAPGNVTSGTLTIPLTAAIGTTTRLRLVLRESGTATDTQACGTYGYGETQDYLITVTAPPLDLPTCAQTATPNNAAVGVVRNPTLTWSGTSGFPTSFDIYFGTSENPGFVSNVPAATTSFAPGALMANTTYYWKIVPKNGNGEAEGCLVRSFTTGSGFDYCVSGATNTSDTKVGSFTFAGSTRPTVSGCATYTNRTADASFVIQQGVETPVSVTLGSCSNFLYASYAKVFIDVNQNGTFEQNEMFFQGALTNTAPGNVVSGNVTLPLSSLTGSTRLRLVLREFGSATDTQACGTYGYGETQDYTVSIIEQLPTTQLRTQFCNTTLASLNDNIYASVILGAASYKFRVENNGNVQEITRPDSRFSMAFATGISLGTTYNVSVATNVNGVWSVYGPVCTVTTPVIYPTTSLRTQFCNTTLSSLNDNIYANVVVGATGYKFKVENNGNMQEVERSDSRFTMAFANNIAANTIYNISVSLNFNGVWQPYGNVCTITTPAALPTSQLRPQFCGNSVSAINSNFFAVFTTGATAYRFKTTINGNEVVVERPDSRCFMSAFAGATMNQTYPIQVAVRINNVWSAYGPVCNLTVGSVVSREIPTETIARNFELKAYPNPFVSNFTLSLSNENLETNIAIFDMTGKMVQAFKTSDNEVNVGENLTAGVYLVNITQGQEIKNIRVVKQ